MELQHVNIKIPVKGELAVDTERFIEVFHQWTAEQVFDDMLIDVADYRHVPSGPGVVLVGLEADYAMDHAVGQWGLLYNRKAEVTGTNQDRFAQALRSAWRACELLEQFFQRDLRFSRSTFRMTINDRALAPNSPETWGSVRPEIDQFSLSLFGHSDFRVEQQSDPRCRLGANISSSSDYKVPVAIE